MNMEVVTVYTKTIIMVINKHMILNKHKIIKTKDSQHTVSVEILQQVLNGHRRSRMFDEHTIDNAKRT